MKFKNALLQSDSPGPLKESNFSLLSRIEKITHLSRIETLTDYHHYTVLLHQTHWNLHEKVCLNGIK